MYDLKNEEMPLAGYTLVLRSPTLHQQNAIIEALRGIEMKPVFDALLPAISAATGEGVSFARALFDAAPVAVSAFVEHILKHGVALCVEAACIALDTRANHRRLSGKPVDEDFDPARIEDFERGPDGSTYLECPSLRAFIRGNITVGESIWVMQTAAALGGYADLGKALMTTVARAMGSAASMAPSPTTRVDPPISA